MIFVFAACTYSHVEVIVENTTEHDIKIKAYFTEDVYGSSNEEVRAEILSIQPYANYIRAQDYHPEDSRYYYLFLEQVIDSVYIIFDDEKRIVQSCKDYELGMCGELVERNILAIGIFYDREDISRKEYHFTYQITQEDYDRAKPIN